MAGYTRFFACIIFLLLFPARVLAAESPDINNDHVVNIFDYNILVSKFKNPYTIFDYNTLLENFGKTINTRAKDIQTWVHPNYIEGFKHNDSEPQWGTYLSDYNALAALMKDYDVFAIFGGMTLLNPHNFLASLGVNLKKL